MKAKEQIEGVVAKHFKWERMSEIIGDWKKDFPQESDMLCKEIWGNEQNKKIPILYGKKGKLKVINPSKIKNFSFLPTEEVLSSGYMNHFELNIQDENDFIQIYDEWSLSVGEILEKCKNNNWTFLFEEKIETMTNMLQQYEDVKKEVLTWSKQNTTKILYSSKNKNIAQNNIKMIRKYKKHFSDCKEKNPNLIPISAQALSCPNCESIWEYDYETKKVTILKTLQQTEKQIKQALFHYEEKRKKEKESKEIGNVLQKKYSHLQEEFGLGHIQKELVDINKESKKEDIILSDMEENIEQIKQIVMTREVLFRTFKQELLQTCDIDDINNKLKKIAENKKLPKTKQTFAKWIKNWKAFLSEKEKEWETCRKNIVKHLPTTYTFQNTTLNMSEVKACLLLLQELDGSYGFHLVADILKGSKQKKIYEFSLQKQTQYGLLQRSKKDEVLDVLFGFQRREWLVQKGQDYPKIHITKKGLQQLQRLVQKETLLEKNEDILHQEKQNFLSQKLEKFLSSLEVVIAFEDWKEEYLLQSYQKEGVSFYKKILQHYRESKDENVVVETFLQKNYEEKYRPIYVFYEKTHKSGTFHAFLQNVLSQKEKVK